MPQATLYGWLRRGRLKARQQEEKVPYRWIVWADEGELERLKDCVPGLWVSTSADCGSEDLQRHEKTIRPKPTMRSVVRKEG